MSWILTILAPLPDCWFGGLPWQFTGWTPGTLGLLMIFILQRMQAGSGGRNFADKDLYEDYSATAGGYGRTYSMTEYGGCGGGNRN